MPEEIMTPPKPFPRPYQDLSIRAYKYAYLIFYLSGPNLPTLVFRCSVPLKQENKIQKWIKIKKMGLMNSYFVFLLLSLFALFGGLSSAPQKEFSQPANATTNVDKEGLEKYPESFQKLVNKQWDDFKNTFKRTYSSAEEEDFRKNVFADNLAKIQNFNDVSKNGFVQAINPLADLSQDEFNKLYNGFKPDLKSKKPGKVFELLGEPTLSDNLDWRRRDFEIRAVTKVKDQNRGCAACYAFAAAAALESQHYLQTGQKMDLSVQNIIDCSQSCGNNGCDGGTMNAVFEYVQENKGIMSNESYPYEAKTSQCRYTKNDLVASYKGWYEVRKVDEILMAKVLSTKGPLVAAIDASRESFQFYSHGIYDDPQCSNKPEDMNHGVLVVGFGQDFYGKKYWIVKNSYGPEWGIDGYVKIAKNNGNQCGIANFVSFPYF